MQRHTRPSARLKTARMSFAQARAAALSHRDRKARFAAAIMTQNYYYCFSQCSYAVKGFASLTLALLKQVFLVDSPSGEQIKAKTSFRLRAPLRGDSLRCLRETVVAIRRRLSGSTISTEKETTTMIQITRHSERQFARAAERAKRERMLVQPAGYRRYFVTNRRNGHKYEVFFCQLNGKRFGACNCEAGYPMNSRHVPVPCKHLWAALVINTVIASRAHVGH
jgi:hypothetical protein